MDQDRTLLTHLDGVIKQATLRCYMNGELLNDPPRLKKAIAFLLPRFEAGDFVPHVDERQFSLTLACDAFRHLESNTQVGKVVLNI